MVIRTVFIELPDEKRADFYGIKVGSDRIAITYEYWLELQKLIDSAIYSVALTEDKSYDATALAQVRISPAPHCKLTDTNDAFDQLLYVDSVIKFVDSFFSISIDKLDLTSSTTLRRLADKQWYDVIPSTLLARFPSLTYFCHPNVFGQLPPKSRLLNFFGPVHQQRDSYTCGPAALKMVADFYMRMGELTFCDEQVSNRSVWKTLSLSTESELSKQMKTTAAEGSRLVDMRAVLMIMGLSVIDDNDGLSEDDYDEKTLRVHKEKRWDKIAEILNLGIPVIINLRDRVEDGHYEIAIGLDAQNIMLADPGAVLFDKIESELMPKEMLINRWKNMSGKLHGRFLIVPPNAASARAIEAILNGISYYFNGRANED